MKHRQFFSLELYADTNFGGFLTAVLFFAHHESRALKLHLQKIPSLKFLRLNLFSATLIKKVVAYKCVKNHFHISEKSLVKGHVSKASLWCK